MHALAVPLFRDATGVAVPLTAWARHRCLQLYLGPAVSAGPIVSRIIIIIIYLFFFNLPGTFGGLNVLKNS